MDVTNNYGVPITLQKMNCFYIMLPINVTVNRTIAAGNTISVTIPCRVIPPGGFVSGLSFNTTAYYTVNGQNTVNAGHFNFTTLG
jgi:hypothetical protein